MDRFALEMAQRAAEEALADFASALTAGVCIHQAAKQATERLRERFGKLQTAEADGKSGMVLYLDQLGSAIQKAFWHTLAKKHRTGELLDLWAAFRAEFQPAMQPRLF